MYATGFYRCDNSIVSKVPIFLIKVTSQAARYTQSDTIDAAGALIDKIIFRIKTAKPKGCRTYKRSS